MKITILLRPAIIVMYSLFFSSVLTADITLDDFESGTHTMTTAPFAGVGQYDTHDPQPGAVGPLRLIDQGVVGSATDGLLTTSIVGGDLVIDFNCPVGTAVAVAHGIFGGLIGIPASGSGDVDVANLDTIPVPLDLRNEVAFEMEYTYSGVPQFSIVEFYAFGTTTNEADFDRSSQFNLQPGTHTVTIPLDTFFNNVDPGLVGAVGISFVGLGSGNVQIHNFAVVGGSTGAVEITPDTFEFTAGNYASGDVSDLATSDNVDVSGTRSSTDIQSRVFMEMKSISPTQTPMSLEFTIEASVFARTNVDQAVDMWDYTAGAWEEVSNVPAARFADSVTVAMPSGDLSRFVESGTGCIEARCRFQSTNPRQRFSANVDQILWTIE